MPSNPKSRKYTSRNHNRTKHTCVNTDDPTTHLRNAQCMRKDAWTVARQITPDQYAEV